MDVARHEFSWQSADSPRSHDYLRAPVIRRLRRAGAKAVLDLGCGNGAFTALLAREGFAAAGLDQSESGISVARRSFPDLPFEVHDLIAPLPASHGGRYDAVIAIEVIEHLLLPRRLMRSALAALRPGGVLIITTPFHGYFKNVALALAGAFDEHWHPLRDFGHVKFFSRRTLTALFEEHGLSALEFTTAGRIPPLAKSMLLSGRKCS